MSAHRYWRWVSFTIPGSYFEVGELRVVNGSTRLSATMSTGTTPGTGAGTEANLADDNLNTRAYWTQADAQAGGFWVQADLGTAQVVTGMQIGSFDTTDRFPSAVTLQWSDNASDWTTFGSWSGMTYPGYKTWGPVLTPPAHVTSGLVFMLDPASYSGGQVWGASPYDFILGSSSGSDSADPTHAGTYWTFDGGDYFTAVTSANAFIQGMHKAGSEWTIEAWWYPTGSGGNVHPIFDSGTVDGGGSDMSRGVIFGEQGSLVNPEGRWGVRVMRDSSGTPSLNAYLATPPALNAWHQHAVSFTGSGGSFLWLDGAVAASNLGSTTWDGTLSSPGTTDTANPARIGARGDGAFRVANGSRLGVIRVYNRALSQAELTQNWLADQATYFPDSYIVAGSVRVNGVVLTSPRRVRVHRRSDGVLLGESDTVDGLFSVPVGVSADEVYIVPIDLDPDATDWAPPCANRVVPVLATD